MADILEIVRCDMSANVWAILIKFGTTMHISHPNLTGDQMFKHLKIQDGGTRPSWNRKNVTSRTSELITQRSEDEIWNKILAIKKQIFMVKTSQFATKCKIDCWVIGKFLP